MRRAGPLGGRDAATPRWRGGAEESRGASRSSAMRGDPHPPAICAAQDKDRTRRARIGAHRADEDIGLEAAHAADLRRYFHFTGSRKAEAGDAWAARHTRGMEVSDATLAFEAGSYRCEQFRKPLVRSRHWHGNVESSRPGSAYNDMFFEFLSLRSRVALLMCEGAEMARAYDGPPLVAILLLDVGVALLGYNPAP